MMFLFLQNFAQRLSDFVNAYFFLRNWHLASLKHCYYIFKHPKPMAFASMLHCLSAAGLLTDESIELIFNYDHRKYEQLISCIRIIKDESFSSKICILGGWTSRIQYYKTSNSIVLNQQILNTLVNSHNIGDLYSAIMILKQENLLNEGYLNHICLHQSPVLLAEGLRTLNLALIDKDVNILTRQDLINALNIHEKPRFLAKCLSILRSWDFERGRSYFRTWRSFALGRV